MGFFQLGDHPVAESRAEGPQDRATGRKLLLQILSERGWDLAVFNLIYFLFCVPMLWALWSFLTEVPLLISAGMLILSGLLAGPASVAMAKLVVSLLRGTAYDPYRIFFSAFRENWRRGALAGVAAHAVAAVLLVSAVFYLFNPGAVSAVLLTFCGLLTLALVLVMFYVYMMLANIQLPTSATLRNAVLLLLLTPACTGCMVLLLLGATIACLIAMPYTLFLVPIVYFSFLWLFCGYLCWQTILGHVAKPEE